MGKITKQMPPVLKHPYAIQRERVSWDAYRAKLPSGTTLLSVTPMAPAGITATDGGVIGDVSTVILSGGTAGRRYGVVLRSEWSNGDTDDRTLSVEVSAQVLASPEPILLDPSADKFYGIDWSALLDKVGGGAVLSVSTWPAVTGIAIDTASIVGTVAQARFSAATLGRDIVVENRVDLSNGDKDARNLLFRVRQL